jgi:hypothetical protein
MRQWLLTLILTRPLTLILIRLLSSILIRLPTLILIRLLTLILIRLLTIPTRAAAARGPLLTLILIRLLTIRVCWCGSGSRPSSARSSRCQDSTLTRPLLPQLPQLATSSLPGACLLNPQPSTPHPQPLLAAQVSVSALVSVSVTSATAVGRAAAVCVVSGSARTLCDLVLTGSGWAGMYARKPATRRT